MGLNNVFGFGSLGGSGGGGGSYTPVILPPETSNYTIPAGKLLKTIVIEDGDGGVFPFSVGTSEGGTDIIDNYTVSTTGIFDVSFYRITDQEIFFTGNPPSSTIKLYLF